MRIVYLADAPYIHTRRWVQHFAQLGHETHVISFRPAEIEGATVHYVDGFERAGKARYLLHARRVSALIRELRPDLLHALHLTSYGFLAGLSAVQPSIVSVWGTDVLEVPSITPAHRWITRQALARAGAITATGMRLAEATLPHTPPGKPVAVIPYGIDLAMFRPGWNSPSPPAERGPGREAARSRLGELSADEAFGLPLIKQPARPHPSISPSPLTERGQRGEVITIGAVARLSPEKGLEYLLRAVSMLAERANRSYDPCLPLQVVLAGDGPSRESLEYLTAELRIDDRVRFLGEIAHEDVPSVLQTFDIFAMPSIAEGFGVSALEASAMELPVIASDVHGIPDVVVHNQTGILTPPRDVDAIADAITHLIADVDLRRAMGVAGRAHVEQRYQWRENAKLMEHLYAEVTARPRSN